VAFPTKQQPANLPPAAEKKPAAAPAPVEAKPKPKAKPKSTSPCPWGRFARILVSLAVVFHLTAVFTAPWYLQLYMNVVPMVEPGGTPRREFGDQRPELARVLAKNLRHYANLLYINHGYEFFSPDPSVSHLIRYEVFSDAGEKIASGEFPNRRQQWPRLFYHRHMMLVEQIFEPGATDARIRQRLDLIADRLIESYHGGAARLQLVRHHLLTPQEVKAGQRIDGESTYESLVVIERQRQIDPTITPGGG
jgi:hypothetical protein